MALKRRPEKRARVEETGVERRIGVTWRRNPTSCVVEMRLPKAVADLRLGFGSYKNEVDAMIARDYGAFVRDSTGKEDRATVGGYCNPVDHPSIFEFEECREIFESLEGSKARCEEYKSLLEFRTEQRCSEFCTAARKDIGGAIKLFWSRRDPQKFVHSRSLNHLPKAEPVDGEIQSTPPSSSSEVKVSPAPGCEVGVTMGDGSINFSDGMLVELAISVDGAPLQTLLHMKLPLLNAEQIYMIVKAGSDRIRQELVDKMLEEMEPCTIDPSTIPALE